MRRVGSQGSGECGFQNWGKASYAAVLEIAENGAKRDPHEYRAEFLQLVKRARQLAGE